MIKVSQKKLDNEVKLNAVDPKVNLGLVNKIKDKLNSIFPDTFSVLENKEEFYIFYKNNRFLVIQKAKNLIIYPTMRTRHLSQLFDGVIKDHEAANKVNYYLMIKH